ncbi:NAD(P)-dependent malic enzyme [Candidatus Absconditicoccus praedator]|uniref:NAD(P)-dependent malic enzyme n=1 Tax=Candidatus Absconditicoccus praedator TaxID=2735562 RepID=UPI001E434CE9|nr:NADP-dependent malic enzyme [Candidatus Absconditicoccus praedator]UFX82733.1 NADP-dependent malic enzyme [Candidatus Absconditicoccus praedator]
MNYFEESLKMHAKAQGKIETKSKVQLENQDDLSTAYSPGVAQPCKEIAQDPEKMYDYTIKQNTVAVISDGSAVLGLGNIGSKASMPVMEGKSILFKEFGGVNSFPIIVDTQDDEEFIQTVKNIAGGFGGINLEDIAAPRCFYIEERLKKELDIPVFHDDQHGTAIVTLAGLINGLKITGKNKEDIKVVINGLGAAGVAIVKLLNLYGVKDIIVCDSKGIISSQRQDLNEEKQNILKMTNKEDIHGSLKDAMVGRDVFVGVSVGNAIDKEDIKSMNPDPMIFAMANPIPEIMPQDAKQAGAKIIATGRSDYPNQLNNVLVFPGVFKGALANRVNDITDQMKINAATGLANHIENPNPDYIVPSPLDKTVADTIAKYIV